MTSGKDEHFERISHDGRELAYILRTSFSAFDLADPMVDFAQIDDRDV
jgi:hypothetical protein